jgi:DNA repair protein RecN (Recombination protein N)
MLTRLHIENFALIDTLELEFGQGLCLLTGETGAGKSILVEAVGLLLGERAEMEMVRTGAPEAVVDATFRIEPDDHPAAALLRAWSLSFDGEVVIRRRIARAGRSTATINGAAASISQLRELGSLLVNIHGQHQSQSLLGEEAHRALLDAQPEVAPLALHTAAAWESLSASMSRLRSLQRSRAELGQRLDTVQFQRDEIDRVGPKAGEEEELLSRKNRLQYSGRIVEDASAVSSFLRDGESSASSHAREALRHLESLAEVDPAWAPFLRDLKEATGILLGIAAETERTASTTVFDPEALEQINERLAGLDRLKRKYGPRLDDVLTHREALEIEFRHLSEESLDPEAAARQVTSDFEAFTRTAAALTKARSKAAAALAEGTERELKPLALEKAKFLVELLPVRPKEATDARPVGCEDVRFLFSANPGEPPKPLAKIASGGELSRTLLALLSASTAGRGPETLIFDEVDAGIGGKPAERVGKRLRDLAAQHQVLCITHLPQIAAFAHHHVKVEKETRAGRTLIKAGPLSESQRVDELARMLAGETVTETARRHAEELLRAAVR